MYHILYNPLAAHGQGQRKIQGLKDILRGQDCLYEDIREVKDYKALFANLKSDDKLVIAGGDGTLCCFINATDGILPENEIYYYAAGNGNDFYRDISKEPDKLIKVNSYIKNLPTVEVNGMTKKFLNGIGYGIDGYCCEVGDQLAKTSEKPINYTAIAIKGLLFHYKPTNAKITVDGVTKTFEKVWLAPSMNGRYYGGGMNVTPAQDRLNEEKKLSVGVFHGSGKLKTLMIFPSIFKGEHISHTDVFSVMTGHHITVEFDRPTALQIDGETVLGVKSYTVHAGVPAKEEVATV
ncbi:MAG: diacylglycerol kinase family protein [Clostridia bacterium]|nr:diacylglycerol kinase family protein [Clostridia bacterium]